MAAIAVIFSKNAVHSALFLLLNFIMLAGLYILMSAQFIAALQVIVYAGAIVVLILFVIMLLGAELGESVPTWFTPKNMFVALLSLILLTLAGTAVKRNFPENLSTLNTPSDWGSVENVGMALFTDYVLAFEIAGVLLLVGIIGVVVLSGWERKIEEIGPTPIKQLPDIPYIQQEDIF